MEPVVVSYLLDIISQINPPKASGTNNYHIEIKHELFHDFILYKGSKHFVWCRQVGQVMEFEYFKKPVTGVGNIDIINLADPLARDKMILILTAADH